MPRAQQLAACGVTCALLILAAHADAQPHGPVRVALGELSGARAPELGEALRDTLRRTRDVRLTDRPRAQLVLRGSVQRIERRVVDGQVQIDCEVSVIVADARGGAIRAMLRGRAGARGGTDEAALSGNALRAAVRGALRPLRASGHALARGY